MKRFASILFACALVTTLAGVASAHPHSPRIDRREARQHARIHEGVRRGQLTPREAARLRVGQRHVRRMEYRAKADGVMTLRERARINRGLNHQSRAIRRFRHNGRMI